VFVIDTSDSMTSKDASGATRMDLARDELLFTLGKLSQRTLFNIVTFSGAPILWQKELKKATPENKSLAKEWLLTQNPFGQTGTYDTFKTVFEEVGGLDTIFFLSDGLPTAGRYVLQEKVLAEVSKMNQFLKVKINCIALLVGKYDQMGAPEEDKEYLENFMRRLAEENNGTFIVRK
jgi:type I restriction-modification system DNA methylase subunit